MVAGFALEGRGDRQVIGIDASETLEKTRDQVTRIAATPRRHRRRPRPARRRDHAGGRLRGAGLRRPGRGDRRGHPAGRAHGGHAHRPGLRGQVDGRLDRPGPLGEIPAGSRVLYAHLGGQPALPAYAGCRASAEVGCLAGSAARSASLSALGWTVGSPALKVPGWSWYGGTLPGASAHRPHWTGEEPCPRGWTTRVRPRQCRRAARTAGCDAAHHRPGWRLDDHEARHR